MLSQIHILRFHLSLILVLGLSSLVCASNASISFPFETINGLTIIQAEVDGQTGSYLLDTGSDGIFLDGAVINSDHSIVTLGGTSQISTKTLQKLTVGTFYQENIEAQIISLEPIEDHLGIDLKGIIGGHFFLPKVLYIDFAKSRITLSDRLQKSERKQFENKVNIELVHDIPIATVKIENKTYQFALDSGSSIHFIDTETLHNLNMVIQTNDTATMKCLANTNKEIQKVQLESFYIGNACFSNQTYLHKDFEDVNATLGITLNGILSLSQLSKDVVVVDYAHRKMYF